MCMYTKYTNQYTTTAVANTYIISLTARFWNTKPLNIFLLDYAFHKFQHTDNFPGTSEGLTRTNLLEKF